METSVDQGGMPPLTEILNKFKKGQWIIRKWKKKYGGEIDLTKFHKPHNKNEFFHEKYFRIEGKNLSWMLEPPNGCDYLVEYKDSRVKFQWRLATKEELNKYACIIINSSEFKHDNRNSTSNR